METTTTSKGLLEHAAKLEEKLKKEPDLSDELLRRHIKKLRVAQREDQEVSRQVA